MCLDECLYSSDGSGERAAMLSTLIGIAKPKGVDTRPRMWDWRLAEVARLCLGEVRVRREPRVCARRSGGRCESRGVPFQH